MRMSESLLTLQDGFVFNFSEKSYIEDHGCGTCGYGSEYIRDLFVTTSQGKWQFETKNTYEYLVPRDFILTAILKNIETFKSMTVTQFIVWLTQLFNNAVLAENDNAAGCDVMLLTTA